MNLLDGRRSPGRCWIVRRHATGIEQFTPERPLSSGRTFSPRLAVREVVHSPALPVTTSR
jgi:hypothetical protein